jgi:lipoate-protein ligase A
MPIEPFHIFSGKMVYLLEFDRPPQYLIFMTNSDAQNAIYFVDYNCDAYFAMAFDEWLFAKLRNQEWTAGIILRLYTWKSGAVTLGYNQDPYKAIDFTLMSQETPVIRRVTGGRAIYHDPSEFTISLIANLEKLRSEQNSFTTLNRLASESIVDSLDHLGIKADWSRNSPRSFSRGTISNRKSCFNSVTRYEISGGKSKIAGFAQKRTGNFAIIQGSLKIQGVSPYPAIGQIEVPPQEALTHYRKEKFENMLVNAFAQRFGTNFVPGLLCETERADLKIATRNLEKKSLKKRSRN